MLANLEIARLLRHRFTLDIRAQDFGLVDGDGDSDSDSDSDQGEA